MQESVCFQERLFDVEFKTVAEYVVGHNLHTLGETRQQAFGRERHENFALPSGETVVAVENGVIPIAVERFVTVAGELRTGIFRKRNVADFKRCSQTNSIHNPSDSQSQ